MVDHGGRPLSVLRYRLTAEDALAYERLPREWTGWRKAAVFLLAMVVGALLGLLEDTAGFWRWALVAALLLVCFVADRAVSRWRMIRRAQARAAHEGEVEVEEWGDHLAIRSGAGEVFLDNETIGRVTVGEGHVFIMWRGGSLILPQRAFDGPDEMQAFGDAVDRRSAEAAS